MFVYSGYIIYICTLFSMCMKKRKKYVPLNFEVRSCCPGTLLASSFPVNVSVTNVPIAIPDRNVSVEEFQSGFSDGGVDFKDLSF